MTDNNSTQQSQLANSTQPSLDVSAIQQQFRHAGLGEVLNPTDNLVVTGALNPKVIDTLKQAGIAVVINVQPEDELTFDEQTALTAVGIDYVHIPIRGAEDLTQMTIVKFDKALQDHQGKNTLMHCKSGNRVGAAVALRAGWLCERKLETAMAQGKAAGLLGLEQEVKNRLLVPR